jgi:hypothetical protein
MRQMGTGQLLEIFYAIRIKDGRSIPIFSCFDNVIEALAINLQGR